METRPPAERFWMARFAAHATRGIIRDQRTRRRAMAILVLAALVMMAAGPTGLGDWLDPREHSVRFILFWFVCGWLTLTALLLAALDLLLVRAQGRAARNALRGDINTERPEPGKTDEN